ncbi:MAG: hypothetical protein KDC46_01330 [Thermoleophilia bacterium]|nr:hypothetical protein [Thermoleophilia bacterium]
MDARRFDRTARAALAAAVVAAAIGLAAVPAPTIAFGAPEVDDPATAVASAALDELSLVDRAGQVVMTSLPGERGAVLTSRTRRQLARLRPGGVIVFGENYRSRAQLTRLLRSAQAAARAGSAGSFDMLVSIDQEGGVVKRIPTAPPFNSHPRLGALDRVDVTKRQAAATAVALRRLGITMDLAPVADLDEGPRRVMRERSFGRSSFLVSRHVAAFVRGLQSSSVAAAVKHFPGFGGASVNSDDALATITRTRTQLAFDLRPFQAAVAAGTESVMVSHGVYRWIDRRRPASTSPAVYRMLRRDLGFDGVAITDSLHADGFGAAARTSVPVGCVQVIRAGADIALLTGSLTDALRCRAQLVAAVRDGRLSRARLDEAAVRVLRLKVHLGAGPGDATQAGG